MIRIPRIIEKYYPELIWRMEASEKALYLTFDDGPTVGITDWVLDQLLEYNAKATFFCIGKNVLNQKVLFQRIIHEGHAVGNHTFDHKRGWSSRNFDYVKNVMKCDEIVQSNLFRPPYGRIKKTQINSLKKKFKIVMWDVLSEDYNRTLSPEKCLKNVLNQSKSGSIIVFHDSAKAERNLKATLPHVLQYFHENDYSFKTID